MVESSSLVSPDPDVLFTTAGMHPLIPYLLGEEHPGGRRLVDVQRCLRTVDIDEVGDRSHLTFFEMLGNWSLGDYFKEESLRWTLEFLVDEIGLDPDMLCVTVFGGDETVGPDRESERIWRSLGLPGERIHRCGREDNWWQISDVWGPCGPDSEVFLWVGPGEPQGGPETPGWVEIWNNVFMGFENLPDGRMQSLPRRNVDTGMGLERLLMVLEGKSDVYETEPFRPLMEMLLRRCPDRRPGLRSRRLVCDHVRSSVFLLMDGVEPSNTGHGYVLRRLLRSAIRHLELLDCGGDVLVELGELVCDLYGGRFPGLDDRRVEIVGAVEKERERFRSSLKRGLRQLRKEVGRRGCLGGPELYRLFETHGLPVEVTVEELRRLGCEPSPDWRRGFEEAREEHRRRSRR